MCNISRFQYNYKSLDREKKLNKYSFPLELDIQPYCQSEDEDEEEDDQKHETNEYMYDLIAVLVHRGTLAHSGHYYAYIRDLLHTGKEDTYTKNKVVQNNEIDASLLGDVSKCLDNWFCYDDVRVYPVPITDIAKPFGNGKNKDVGCNTLTNISTFRYTWIFSNCTDLC